MNPSRICEPQAEGRGPDKSYSQKYPISELAGPLCFAAYVFCRWCKLDFGPEQGSGRL